MYVAVIDYTSTLAHARVPRVVVEMCRFTSLTLMVGSRDAIVIVNANAADACPTHINADNSISTILFILFY